MSRPTNVSVKRAEKNNSPRRTVRAKSKRSPIRQLHAKKVEKAVMPTHFTGAQDRYLRALGHSLDAVVMVGKEGITDALVAQAKLQLKAHELIKVKVQPECPEDRKEAAEILAKKTRAHVAQVLGRTFLLYLVNPDKNRIVVPDANAAKLAKAASANARTDDLDD